MEYVPLQSLSNVVTAGALHCWKVVNVLPSLSNIVSALANGRLLAVGSCSRAWGLLQKPSPAFLVAPWRQGWLQARWVRERVGKIWPAISLEPEGLGDFCLLWLVAGLMGHVLECFQWMRQKMKSHWHFMECSHSFIRWMSHLWLHSMKRCFNEKAIWWKGYLMKRRFDEKALHWKAALGFRELVEMFSQNGCKPHLAQKSLKVQGRMSSKLFFRGKDLLPSHLWTVS